LSPGNPSLEGENRRAATSAHAPRLAFGLEKTAKPMSKIDISDIAFASGREQYPLGGDPL